MTRAKWKGPFIQKEIVLKTNKQIAARNTVILPKFVGLNFHIYNGKIYTNLIVKETMIYHKFGEFSFTRFKN